jgi:hypothetical protein
MPELEMLLSFDRRRPEPLRLQLAASIDQGVQALAELPAGRARR